MKIIVHSLIFYPDHSGIALYASDFAFYASENGHEVKVVTGFPFYPKWQKSDQDKWAILRREIIDKVEVLRGYTYVPNNPSTFKRLMQEILLLIFSCINFIKAGKPDCIVVFTTPVTFGLLGYLFKIFYRSKLLINVQDFQVDAASSLNMVKGSFLINLLSKIEKISYRGADIVTSISSSMVQILDEKEKNINKKLLWPNWIDYKKASLSPTLNLFREKYSIGKEKKIIAYAGNIGLKQGLNIIIDLARKCEKKEDYLFLIIGDGAGLKQLKIYSTKFNLNNLIFIPFLNSEEYRLMLADIDIFFLPQKKVDKDIYFPSKLLGILALGKIILLSADKDSELYRVLNRNKVALISNYGDIDKMVEHLNNIEINSALVEVYRERAKKFAKEADRSNVLNNVFYELDKICKN